jgi:hypothetical protein
MQVIESPRKPAERLAGDLAAALDPVVFAQRLGIEPDPWQAGVLRSTDNRMLLNCSRQSGKTTTTALVGLHTALYVPESLVLVLSPSLRQSGEFFRTLAGLYNRTGGEMPPKAESSLRLELANGSRIVSLPASEATVRGFAGVRLLLLDEASRVPDELFHAVRPMIATTNGRIVALSTPWGKRGWWAEAWHSGQAWQRVLVPAAECPRISAAFLAEAREAMGQWWFDQEFNCLFLDAESQAFTDDDVWLAIAGERVEPWVL